MPAIAVAVVSATWPIACASRQGPAAQAPATPEAEVALANRDGGPTESLFDLAACFPRSIHVRGRPTRESIIATAVSARPAISECLVDPKNRGSDKNTKVNVDIAVTESSVENRVTGDNLTPAGQTCIKGVLDELHAFDGTIRDGGTVISHAEFNQAGNISPTVTFGASESSDITGEIRVAQRSWCQCFEPWKATAPETLKSQLHFAKDKAGKTTVKVEFRPIRDSAVEKVQKCLADSIQALGLTIKAEELSVPHTFFFLHSGLNQELPEAPPLLNFWQWRAVRNQRTANVALKLADRVNAVTAYEGLVTQYRRRPGSSLVPRLRSGCSALLAADAAWIEALEHQLDADKHILAAVNPLRGNELSGLDIETIQRQLSTSQADLETANKTKAADAAACPSD